MPAEALDLGPLAVATINDVLPLQLEAGRVHFSARAQEHAQRRHPQDFTLCLRHLPRIVRAPDYIGQGPDEADGFELVGEARSDRAIVLVAVKVQRDEQGRYIVASTYRISRRTLLGRLDKGRLARI